MDDRTYHMHGSLSLMSAITKMHAFITIDCIKLKLELFKFIRNEITEAQHANSISDRKNSLIRLETAILPRYKSHQMQR